MFLQMLKDEFPDVRLHIISKLEQVNKGAHFFGVVSITTNDSKSLVSNLFLSLFFPL